MKQLVVKRFRLAMLPDPMYNSDPENGKPNQENKGLQQTETERGQTYQRYQKDTDAGAEIAQKTQTGQNYYFYD